VSSARVEFRFIVDDASFGLEEVDGSNLEVLLDGLADQLQLARERQEPTGIVSGFERFECQPGVELHQLLTGDDVSRDCRNRIFGLLDKCGRLDANPDFYVEPRIEVNGQEFESYAIATILAAQRDAVAVGALSLATQYGPGIVSVTDASGDGHAVVVAGPESRVAFYRWIYSTEGIDEGRFFELALLAFPQIKFADGVTFRRFEGSYAELRERTVRHLSRINDSFRASYIVHLGRSDEVSAAMKLDISMESQRTRSSERLMSERDASYRGRTYRCEWHSKIEPHRNRIHLHPGDELSEECVVVGCFVDHLPT
jgi:hypothetical protein